MVATLRVADFYSVGCRFESWDDPFELTSPSGASVANCSMTEISGLSLKQGAAGTTHFEPGGVPF
jgi:hypothetical protein